MRAGNIGRSHDAFLRQQDGARLLDSGYQTTIVAATATRDPSDSLGGVVPAETVQRVALADRFASVTDVRALEACSA